jgi:3-oxoacyl-[acyl-carrier-protein] synthase II
MTACAASTQAIGEAFEIIRRGDADLMLAGGAHSMIHPLGMTGFIRLTAMSKRRDDPTKAARPFDKTRDGFVMGEGAGMLVLETLDHAMARGATPLAEIVGLRLIRRRLPHHRHPARRQGRGRPRCDPGPAAGGDRPARAGTPTAARRSTTSPPTAPARRRTTRSRPLAVKAVFGPLAPKVPFSSVKSMMGHLIQAAGAVELITCVHGDQDRAVPPTINLNTPTPTATWTTSPTRRATSRQGGVDVCLSNSFGFGGPERHGRRGRPRLVRRDTAFRRACR